MTASVVTASIVTAATVTALIVTAIVVTAIAASSSVSDFTGGDSWQEATSRSTSIHGPLPSQKSTPEIFTALPSVPVPAPIAADPLTAPSSSLQPHPAALAPAVVQAGSTVSTATAVDAGNGHSAAAAGTVKAARQPGVAVTYVNLEVQAGSKTGFDSWNTQSAGGEVTDSRQSASDSGKADMQLFASGNVVSMCWQQILI